MLLTIHAWPSHKKPLQEGLSVVTVMDQNPIYSDCKKITLGCAYLILKLNHLKAYAKIVIRFGTLEELCKLLTFLASGFFKELLFYTRLN